MTYNAGLTPVSDAQRAVAVKSHTDLEIAIPHPDDACVVPCCHSGTSLLLEAAALLVLASTAVPHVAGQSSPASKSHGSRRPICQPVETLLRQHLGMGLV